LREPHESQQLGGGRPIVLGRARPAREGHVLVRRESREQLGALEDVRQAVSPHAALRRLLERRHRLAAPQDGAGGRPHQAAEDVEQRRLAGSRRAPQGDRLVLLDGEVDAVQGADGRAVNAVGDDDAARLGERVHRGVAPCTTAPSLSSITRSTVWATRAEWVTTTTVVPYFSRRRWSAWSTVASFPASSSPVGS